MKVIYLFLAGAFLLNSVVSMGQCGIEAGPGQTIICGGSAQLHAETPWLILNSGITKNLNSVCFANSDTGYATGENGTILKTINGGNNWTSQTSNTTEPLASVFFVNADTGYAVGGNWGKYIILKTIDGGTNWVSKATGTGFNLQSVYFVDADTGYAVGGDDLNYSYEILKTIDGGTTWTSNYSGTATFLKSVFFTDYITGFAVGYFGKLLKTSNAGKTWVTQASGTTSNLYSVLFTDINNGYALSWDGTILKTTNGGTSWIVRTCGISNSAMYSAYFTDKDTGYATGNVSSKNVVFKTVDGANSWTYQVLETPYIFNSINFSGSKTGYAVGNLGKIIKLQIADSVLWSPASELSELKAYHPIAQPVASTTYTINAYNSGSCVSTDTVRILVDPFRVYTGADKSIVCGGKVQLDTSYTNYTGSGTLSYSWLPVEGLNNADIVRPIVEIIANKTYVLSVTTPNGCVANDSVMVTVNPFTVNSGEDKSIVCGGKVQFDNPINNYTGSGTLIYSWLPVEGLDNHEIPRPTAEIISDKAYRLSVSTPNGCIAVDSINVTVNDLTVNCGADKSVICGGKVQFDRPATNFTGSGTLSYSWTPTNGLDTANLAQPRAEITTDMTFTLSLSTPNGCIAIDSVIVSVDSLIALAEDIIDPCGSAVQLNVTTNYTGSGTLLYKWLPASGLSADTIASPLVTIETPTAYSVEVQTPNGCIATDSARVFSAVTSFDPSICMVTVNDNDKNVIVWQKIIDPSIDTFFIYRESQTQTNSFDLIGKLTNDVPCEFTDTGSNARVQSNKYRISVKDVCGFETSKSQEHKTMHLTINKGIGNIWNLIWEPYIGQEVSNYTIYRGADKTNLIEIGTTSGSNTTYTDETAPTGNIYYMVEVSMPQPCSNFKSTDYSSSRSNVISTSTSRIQDNVESNTFIYPNPAYEKLYFKNIGSDNAVITICNLQGNLILTRQLINNSIDISDFSDGIYIVKLIDSDQVISNIFIKK
jgi:photosystem II stability/assembly factor-like uncharacterized protein